MPKYMLHGSYNADGVQGLLREGGSGRRAAVEQLVAGMGGTVECFYYTFGREDAIAVVDLPDNETAAAVALAIAASGLVSAHTTVLLTPEQIDAAAQQSVDYRPPGA